MCGEKRRSCEVWKESGLNSQQRLMADRCRRTFHLGTHTKRRAQQAALVAGQSSVTAHPRQGPSPAWPRPSGSWLCWCASAAAACAASIVCTRAEDDSGKVRGCLSCRSARPPAACCRLPRQAPAGTWPSQLSPKQAPSQISRPTDPRLPPQAPRPAPPRPPPLSQSCCGWPPPEPLPAPLCSGVAGADGAGWAQRPGQPPALLQHNAAW